MIQRRLTPENEDEIAHMARGIMRRGGIVIFPTDTLYGLGADAELEEAVDKVYRLKGRDPSKPISVSVHDVDHLEVLAKIDPGLRDVLAAIFPGAFTAILESSGELPHLSMGGKIGVRIPDHSITLKLCRDFPVTATSANPSGMPSPSRAEEVSLEADLILDGGPTAMGLQSTIVDFTGDRPLVLREGSGDGDLLDRALEENGFPTSIGVR